MLVAPAARRRPPGPDPRHGSRSARAQRLPPVPRARLPDPSRRPALAPDRESARQVRLVELAADARGRRGGRAADHLGPVPLRLARSCRPGRRPDFPDASPISRSLRSRCTQSVSGGRRSSARSTRSTSCPGRSTTAISRASGPRSAAGSSASSSEPAIASARAIKQRWPSSTIIWAEPLIHIAPHDQRRADSPRRRGQPSGDVRSL